MYLGIPTTTNLTLYIKNNIKKILNYCYFALSKPIKIK